MDILTKESLLEKLSGKEYVELDDLLQIIEEEFKVILHVHFEEVDVKEIASDSSVIRQIRASREDRKAGRTYSGEGGLQVLREKIKEFERESNL